MGANTNIEWCDHTFNPWRGCQKVSEACRNCYAETTAKRNTRTLGMWGSEASGGTRVVASKSMWKEPLKWDRTCGNYPNAKRPRVFCASFADVFEDWKGPMVDSQGRTMFECCQCHERWAEDMTGYDPSVEDNRPICKKCLSPGPNEMAMADVRRRLFDLIDATPNLDWLLLTKRPENIARMMPEYVRTSPSENWFFDPEEQKRRGLTHAGPHKSTVSVSGVGVVRQNVWIGTTIEDQKTADERIPHLLRVPAKVRFLSCEPLLGPVDLRPKAPDAYSILGKFYSTGTFDPSGMSPATDRVLNCFPKIDWIIAGGESGPGARPMHPDWARSLRDQCQAAGVPFFFKQWGEYHTASINMTTGESSFRQFATHGAWIAKASSRVNGGVCLDADGKVLTIGREFAAARYPVTIMDRLGKKAAGRLLDGRTWDELPEVSS